MLISESLILKGVGQQEALRLSVESGSGYPSACGTADKWVACSSPPVYRRDTEEWGGVLPKSA